MIVKDSTGAEISQRPQVIKFNDTLEVTSDNLGGVEVGLASEFTLVNATTDNTISVDQNGNVGTDVTTDGAIHIENTGNTGIGLGVYTNMDANAAAPLVSILVDNVAFDQPAVQITNDGVGRGLYIYQRVNPATRAFEVYSDVALTTAPFCLLKSDHASSTQQVLQIWDDGNADAVRIDKNNAGNALDITHDDTGTSPSITITRNGNNANRIYGMTITVANAGAGATGGINFSAMPATSPLLRIPSLNVGFSAKSPETDAEAGWIPVLFGTTEYAIPVYALS